MLLAVVLLVIAHWAHGQPAVSGTMIVEVGFAILFVALLDHGATEGIAQGFAWLFLIAVLLSKNSPLALLSKLPGQAAKSGTQTV
jgi:hypothetical protein